MADGDRIVYPDEVEEIKAKAVSESEATETNTIEEHPVEVTVQTRNMITVPSNCPPGQQMGADGVCRDIF